MVKVKELKQKLENIDDDVEILLQLENTQEISEYACLFGRDTEILEANEKVKVVYIRGFN